MEQAARVGLVRIHGTHHRGLLLLESFYDYQMAFARISHDPAVMGGKPCSRWRILRVYPHLEPADIDEVRIKFFAYPAPIPLPCDKSLAPQTNSGRWKLTGQKIPPCQY